MTFERKVPLILFFVVVVMTMFGFAFYQHTTSLQDAVNLEKRAQGVISKLDDTLRLTLDVESSLRGFVITGNDTYLDPYQKAKPKLTQNLAQLKIMVAHSPVEQEQVGKLEAYVADYLAQVERKMEVRKTDGFEAAILSLGDNNERVLTANIRASIDWLKSAELASLQQQEKTLDENFYRTIWILIVGCLAGVIALGVANIMVSREIGKRRNAETALIDANKGLETRIQERTEELENVNESLRTIASERESLLKNEQEARRDAEIANRLRDEFMATVSHELKTPLNSILGWARMLKAGDLDEDQVKKALGTIIKNSETQNRLIEDLLDVARIISGKLELEYEPIDAYELMSDAIEIIRPAAQAKRISLAYESEGVDENLIIQGDRNRLMQVFSNLLGNAVKFTPEGGRVDVAVSDEGTNFTVLVKDNGIGISSEFLPKVFERFRQDLSSTAQNGGLGLGLAIVRQLVEMHGGSVSVDSDGAGTGSQFTVTLPAQRREEFRLLHQA